MCFRRWLSSSPLLPHVSDVSRPSSGTTVHELMSLKQAAEASISSTGNRVTQLRASGQIAPSANKSTVFGGGPLFPSPPRLEVPEVLHQYQFHPARCQSPDLSSVSMVGSTPMVRIDNYVRSICKTAGQEANGKVFLKLDGNHPTGSSTDRDALEFYRQMVLNREFFVTEHGPELPYELEIHTLPFIPHVLSLKSIGQSLCHSTFLSGCTVSVHAVAQSEPKDDVDESGTSVGQYTPQEVLLMRKQVVEQANKRRQELRDQPQKRVLVYDPFSAKTALMAHFRHTGPEFSHQIERDGQRIDCIVDTIGTGAYLTGVVRFLQGTNPMVRSYVVEPLSRQSLAQPERNSGLNLISSRGGAKSALAGFGFRAQDLRDTFQNHLVTAYHAASLKDAQASQRRLWDTEGLAVDLVAASSLTVAGNLLLTNESKSNIVVPVKRFILPSMVDGLA